MEILSIFAKSSGGLSSQQIFGIVLAITGLGLIYFGVKIMQGYELFPQANRQNVPKEDNYVAVNIGWVTFHGHTLPITIGAFGKVFILADENQVRQLIK